MSLSARLYFHVELRARTLNRSGSSRPSCGNHLLGQPVTQIFLVRIAGEVVEGKHRERQPLA